MHMQCRGCAFVWCPVIADVLVQCVRVVRWWRVSSIRIMRVCSCFIPTPCLETVAPFSFLSIINTLASLMLLSSLSTRYNELIMTDLSSQFLSPPSVTDQPGSTFPLWCHLLCLRHPPLWRRSARCTSCLRWPVQTIQMRHRPVCEMRTLWVNIMF